MNGPETAINSKKAASKTDGRCSGFFLNDQIKILIIGSSIGDCTSDTFVLATAGGIGSPVICGFNTGQHSKQF